MTRAHKFVSASAYSGEVNHLPVKRIDEAADWYAKHFSMAEVERSESPVPNVVLERDGVKIGFSENGGDSSQSGAAIRVEAIKGIREELESSGVDVGGWQTDERDGEKLQVFFVVAPDGLCFCFYEPLEDVDK